MTTPSSPRLYTTHDLAAGASVPLTDGQAHYLRTVMRRGAGDPVHLFNGRDGEWRAALETPGRKAAVARIEAALRAQDEEPADGPWLLFAPVKRAPIDLIAEKATELGATALIPVTTARTNAARVNVARLRARAIEAAEQCGRLSVPAVRDPVALDAAFADWPPARRLLVCDEAGRAGPIADALADGSGEPLAVMIGPEGGYAPGELDAVRKLPFVTPVSLGGRILRAETAAIAALACVQAIVGDWRGRAIAEPDR